MIPYLLQMEWWTGRRIVIRGQEFGRKLMRKIKTSTVWIKLEIQMKQFQNLEMFLLKINNNIDIIIIKDDCEIKNKS